MFYVGLDIHTKRISICALDDKGPVLVWLMVLLLMRLPDPVTATSPLPAKVIVPELVKLPLDTSILPPVHLKRLPDMLNVTPPAATFNVPWFRATVPEPVPV
jgi:hypothetical protein